MDKMSKAKEELMKAKKDFYEVTVGFSAGGEQIIEYIAKLENYIKELEQQNKKMLNAMIWFVKRVNPSSFTVSYKGSIGI